MKQADLFKSVENTKNEIQAVFQVIFLALNQGQQKKLLNNETVKALLDRYNIEY